MRGQYDMLTLDIGTVRDALTDYGGFTLDPRTGDLVTVGSRDGWAVALPGTERVIGPRMTRDGMADAFASALDSLPDTVTPHDVFIGGWYSPDRGYMIELSTVHNVSAASAMLLGLLRDQDAVFDIATGRSMVVVERRPIVV